MQVVVDGAYYHLTAVEADAHRHLDAMRAAHLGAVAPHALLHSQGGVTGPHGVVLMRQWRPKQRHDAVSHDLIHRPFIAVYRGHHGVQGRIKQRPYLLWIETLNDLGRALEIGKQDGDLLALTFQSGTSSQELLSEMRGW